MTRGIIISVSVTIGLLLGVLLGDHLAAAAHRQVLGEKSTDKALSSEGEKYGNGNRFYRTAAHMQVLGRTDKRRITRDHIVRWNLTVCSKCQKEIK